MCGRRATPRGCCMARAEEAGGVEKLRGYMREKARQLGIERLRFNAAGCLDRCEFGPNMVIYPEGVWVSPRVHPGHRRNPGDAYQKRRARQPADAPARSAAAEALRAGRPLRHDLRRRDHDAARRVEPWLGLVAIFPCRQGKNAFRPRKSAFSTANIHCDVSGLDTVWPSRRQRNFGALSQRKKRAWQGIWPPRPVGCLFRIKLIHFHN